MDGNSSTGNTAYKGYIDDFIIYDIALEKANIKLNYRNEYINVDDKLNLEITTEGGNSDGAILWTKGGLSLSGANYTWVSSNNDVASVDNNGEVTAKIPGQTTITCTNNTGNLKSMCIVNVAKKGAVAFHQSGTGQTQDTSQSFTAVLKEDGTVWCTGNNANGQLGNGTNSEFDEPTQVKIDAGNSLKDVVKISVGNCHTMALTKDGKVYSWGKNSCGELGVNSTSNSNYAIQVKDTSGNGYLENIIDISCGDESSSAIDESGVVYTWGKNDYGQLGIGNINNQSLPQKSQEENGIKVSQNQRNTAILLQSGQVSTCGDYNKMGIGGTTSSAHSSVETTSIKDIVDIQAIGNKILVRDINGSLYGTGISYYGDLGETANATVVSSFKKLIDSEDVQGKIKYFGGGGQNTVIFVKNNSENTLWIIGDNTFNQIPNSSDTMVTSFTKSEMRNGVYIENLENIGITQSYGGSTSYPQTLTYVDNNGYVYSIGNNTASQYGNGE